jgi:hypothetical protein
MSIKSGSHLQAAHRRVQIFVGLILGLGARVPQILLNYRNGHTGNLAIATFLFNATANTVCAISATVLTGDIYVIGTQIWMFALNTTIIGQILSSNSRSRAADAVRDSSAGIVGKWSYAVAQATSDQRARSAVQAYSLDTEDLGTFDSVAEAQTAAYDSRSPRLA